MTQTTPTHKRAGNSHGTQPATAHLDCDKCFPAGNGHHALACRQEDCFLNPFVHRRTAVAHSEPTKAFPKWSPETAMLSAPFGCHPPLPIRPFCWSRTYLQRSLQEVTSQDESFMPDISGYIQESVKQHYLVDANPGVYGQSHYYTGICCMYACWSTKSTRL